LQLRNYQGVNLHTVMVVLLFDVKNGVEVGAVEIKPLSAT
jgi:hypothetical protein